jgi:hypothetical protein
MAIAHTRIMIGREVDDSTTGPLPGQTGTITKTNYIEPGDKVTQEQLKATDEEWDAYYADGVISDEPLPDELDHANESLNSFKTRRAVEELNSVTERPTRSRRSAAKKEEDK